MIPEQRGTHSARGLAVLALLVYLVLGVVLLEPALLGDAVVSPASFWAQRGPFPEAQRTRVPDGIDLLSDSVTQFTPWLRYAADGWAKDGRIPLWKSLALCGAPLVGNGQSALFFPTHLLAVVLGAPAWTGTALSLFKLVAGAFCAYLLARHLRLSFLAALLAGLVFGFGGYQVLFLQHPHTNVSLLLPLLLLCTDRLVLQPTAGRAAALAIVCGLQHLAGHPETTLHCQLAAVTLGGVRAWSLRRADTLLRRRILMLIGSFFLGVLLGAVQTLPLLEYISQSDALQLRTLRAASAPPLQLGVACGFLAALALGIVCTTGLARGRRVWLCAAGLAAAIVGGLLVGLQGRLSVAWIALLSPDWYGPVQSGLGPTNYVEQNGAFAGAALPLALLGLLAGRPRGAARAGGVLLALGVLALLHAPGIDELLHAPPGLRLAENTRLSLFALLATAMLAGLGLDALGRAARDLGGAPSLRLRFALLLGVVLLAGWGTLAFAVHSGRIPNPNVPGGPDEFPAQIIAATDARQLLPAPLTELLARELALSPEPLKYFTGWFVPPPAASGEGPATVTGARIMYGRHQRSLEALVAPALKSGDPDQPWLAPQGAPIHIFMAVVPMRLFPPGTSTVRLRISLADGRAALSRTLQSPDDPGATPLPFPAQPATARALLPVALLLLVAALTAAVLAARGALLDGARTVLVLLCGASLLPFTAGMLPLMPERDFYPRAGALEALRGLGPTTRMIAMRPGSLPAEIPTAYGLRDVRGYDALHPRRSARLLRQAVDYPPWIASMEALPVRSDIDLTVLGLMAVRGIAEWDAAPADLPRLKFTDQSRLPAWAPFPLVVNPEFLPRVRLVTGCAVEPDDERALTTLLEADFPRSTTAVFATGTPQPASAAPAGVARLGADRPDLVRVIVEPEQSGWLLLADTFFPGWKAFVDGRPSEILRANVAFRAVAVQPGDRLVEFRYEPLSFRLGVMISTAAALLLAGALLFAGLRASGR